MFTILSAVAGLLALGSTLGILWSLFLFPFVGLNIKCYKLTGQKLDNFIKHVKYASIWSDDAPENWIIGKWYIGYLVSDDQDKSTRTMYLIIREQHYARLTSDSQSLINKQGQLYYGKREGSFWNFKYVVRPIRLTTYDPRPEQSIIVNQIYQFYQQNGYCVALITGQPNRGKSMMAHFLGKYIIDQQKRATIIDSFDPTDPGDRFSKLYHKIDPSLEHILIVVLEEIDITIDKIHYHRVIRHKNMPTEITSKVTWNKFLDRFDHQMYQHVILLMTSNLTISQLDQIDPSYLRDNRVNLRYTMD